MGTDLYNFRDGDWLVFIMPVFSMPLVIRHRYFFHYNSENCTVLSIRKIHEVIPLGNACFRDSLTLCCMFTKLTRFHWDCLRVMRSFINIHEVAPFYLISFKIFQISKILVTYNHTTNAATDWPHPLIAKLFCFAILEVAIVRATINAQLRIKKYGLNLALF